MLLALDRYEYPDVEQVTLESGHRYYVCPQTNRKMASVTTILDATADKSGLEAWKKFVGEKRAKMESEIATGIGGLMHEHVEAFIEGRPRPSAMTPPRIMAKEMADRIIESGLCHVSEVIGVEERLFVPGLYAGTVDLIGVYKNKLTIIDHKSAKKMKKKSQIVDYRDQMAAYIIAHNDTYGTNIEDAVVFMSTRTKEFECIEYTPSQVKEGKLSFMDRVEKFYSVSHDFLA